MLTLVKGERFDRGVEIRREADAAQERAAVAQFAAREKRERQVLTAIRATAWLLGALLVVTAIRITAFTIAWSSP